MIEIFRIKRDGKLQDLSLLPGDRLQVRVSCQGDLAVMPFFPTDDCDTGWLVIHEAGEEGEPGSNLPEHLIGPRRLDEQEGILIGARDARSLDVIIAALEAIRARLEPDANLPPLEKIRLQTERDIADEEDRKFLDEFKTTVELAAEKMADEDNERDGGIGDMRRGTPWGKVTQ